MPIIQAISRQTLCDAMHTHLHEHPHRRRPLTGNPTNADSIDFSSIQRHLHSPFHDTVTFAPTTLTPKSNRSTSPLAHSTASHASTAETTTHTHSISHFLARPQLAAIPPPTRTPIQRLPSHICLLPTNLHPSSHTTHPRSETTRSHAAITNKYNEVERRQRRRATHPHSLSHRNQTTKSHYQQSTQAFLSSIRSCTTHRRKTTSFMPNTKVIIKERAS